MGIVVSGPTVADIPDAKYVFKSITFRVYWKFMTAIDNKGRVWKIDMVDGNLVLAYRNQVTIDMGLTEEINDSYKAFTKL